MRPKPISPQPGQESVWDYPRPPLLERCNKRLTVEVAGRCIADSAGAYRVLETSHPPTYYLPPQDILDGVLRANPRRSLCEWKGQAIYLDVFVGDYHGEAVAWCYPTPTESFSTLAGYVSFYAHAMDRCTVDGAVVDSQSGGLYGGWITPDVVGPFKEEPGTLGW